MILLSLAGPISSKRVFDWVTTLDLCMALNGVLVISIRTKQTNGYSVERPVAALYSSHQHDDVIDASRLHHSYCDCIHAAQLLKSRNSAHNTAS